MDGLVIACLGPLLVTKDGRVLRLTARRPRTLLVVLALSAGRTVPVGRLVSAIWDEDELPVNPRASLQTLVTRLRTLVGADLMHTQPDGYRLAVPPDAVDALSFGRLLQEGELDDGLALWRGSPFADLGSGWLDQFERPKLVEQYLAAVERAADLALAAGNAAERLPLLTELAAQHPLRESLLARLLLLLDRVGRTAEALERYETIRSELAETLGVDPSPELREIHTQLLTGTTPAPSTVVPRQLPAAVNDFAGRDRALKQLDELVDSDADGGPAAVVISAIAGAAGIGKTTLAVHWAHRVANRFPDGQLYVNLLGFGPGDQVMDPADAVRRFLDALNVPPQRVPAGVEAQAALYRSVLAGQRVLIVLDNARDADQVRPLLPGAPGCLVLITSRNQLSSLVATEAARPIAIDLLTSAEARQLLTARLGPDRLAAEPDATDEIISRSARLPLALAIIAARAAARPHFPLAAVADELGDVHRRLDVLTGDNPATDLRAVFSWSYRTLTPAAARLFRLLGRHPGPDTSPAAVASLAAISPAEARSLLSELSRASLILEHTPGRYVLHDLMRVYAADLAHQIDGDELCRAATRRMLDHYLQSANAATHRLRPVRKPTSIEPPADGVVAEDPADLEQASAWFTAEHAVLLAAVNESVATGHDVHTWQLARAMMDFLDRKGHWYDWLTTADLAVTAARSSGDLSVMAASHNYLARAYRVLRRPDDAIAQLQQALDLYGRAGDQEGQAHAHHVLALVHERAGRLDDAIGNALQGLRLFRAAGHRLGEAALISTIGWYHAQRGDHREGLDWCRQALTVFQELGDRQGEADTWDSIGYAHHHLGEYTEAISCYHRARDLHREVGNRYFEAEDNIHLGETHLALGDPTATGTAWRQALTILDDLAHPEAAKLRTRIDQL